MKWMLREMRKEDEFKQEKERKRDLWVQNDHILVCSATEQKRQKRRWLVGGCDNR